MNIYRPLLSALLLISISGFGQNLSNTGKEFWVGYGHNWFHENSPGGETMVLYVSTEQAAVVTIWSPSGCINQTVNIPANTVWVSSPMPKNASGADCRLFTSGQSEGKYNRGIRILSDVPVVAYAHTYGSASSGATLLMPFETWGYQYTSVNSAQRYSANSYSFTYVVARNNNTKVRITPAVNTRGGKLAGVPFDTVLNQGEIYQVLGEIQTGTTGYEMTGTSVKSIPNSAGVCHPIAVFSGSSRTYNDFSPCSPTGGDFDMQQLFPSQAWGRRYLTAPTSASNYAPVPMINNYKIVVKDPTTNVYRNGSLMTGIINNLYYMFSSDQPQYITADKPIMVAQFIGSGPTPCLGGGVGDPEMIYISPIEQGIKRVGFYRNNMQQITANYLTLIIPTGGMSSLTINGVNFASIPAMEKYSYAHPQLPGYTIAVKRWNASQAQAFAQSDSAFTAITYGLGSVESYGYNAGTYVNNLNAFSLLNNVPDSSTSQESQYTCKGTPVQITMQVPYKPVQSIWQLSQVNGISPNSDVTVNNPQAVDSTTINGIWYYHYTLPGNYTFLDTGTYQIPVQNTLPFGFNNFDGCGASIENIKLLILVKPKPTPNFNFTHTGCSKDTIQFTTPLTTTNGYTAAQWNWVFPGGSDTVQNPQTIISTPGTHNITLNIITPYGCIGDTTKPITIHPAPYTNFGVSPANLCEGGTVTFTDTSSYAGSSPIIGYYWEFDYGTVFDIGTNTPQTINYPGYGTYTVKHVVRVSNTCISDTAIQVVTVYDNPTTSFTYPAGCLPTDGNVQFTSTASTEDGQALTHSWNFGHPASGAANTSTLPSPTHNYPYGNYTITYTVTTANGCSNDTTVNASFNLAPALEFESLSPVCENTSGTITVATASVTNGVTGTGTYKGPGTSANGNFNPATAGAGTHTIWYVYAANGGCVDSISQTITVYPKPVSNFSLSDNAICLNETTTITDNSTIPSGSITNWNWNFGNGTTASNTNNTPFTQGYTSYGNYTIKLVTVSDQGCISDTAYGSVAVDPMPVAKFSMPASVCMPNGTVNFTNQSTIANNAALSYSWDFGDGTATSTSTNPSHVYATSGSYSVTLTVTSPAGCSDDTTMVFSAFYEKPVASFAVFPAELCQGTNSDFTDQSTAPGSTVQSWNWSFGDGSSSTQQNPGKTYSLPGVYTVSLTVTNAAGCTSDPYTQPVTVFLQPVIDAGPSFTVLEGTTVTFNPTVNDSTIDFVWSPPTGLSDAYSLNPSLVAMGNQRYTLTATGDNNCTATDTLWVRILRPVTVPNAFSPNGDGIHDTWVITNLADYPDATVEVFNRYGQPVYHSYRYNKAWDGTYNGKPLPVATYYYVITLRSGFKPMTGSITIIR